MKPKHIILHHSASPQNQTAATINAYHKGKYNFKSELGYYSGYQYIITKDGMLHQHRKDTEAGAHTSQENMNYQSIGVCITGWYDDGHNQMPTKAQQETLAQLLRDKMKEWNIPRENIKFHRDYAGYKSCPGYHITQDWVSLILGETQEKEQEIINEEPMPKRTDEEYKKTENALKAINIVSNLAHDDNETDSEGNKRMPWWRETIDSSWKRAFERVVLERPWDDNVARENERKAVLKELEMVKSNRDAMANGYEQEIAGLKTSLQKEKDRTIDLSRQMTQKNEHNPAFLQCEEDLKKCKDMNETLISDLKEAKNEVKTWKERSKNGLKSYAPSDLLKISLKRFLGMDWM